MKKYLKTFATLILMALATTSFASCSDSDEGGLHGKKVVKTEISADLYFSADLNKYVEVKGTITDPSGKKKNFTRVEREGQEWVDGQPMTLFQLESPEIETKKLPCTVTINYTFTVKSLPTTKTDIVVVKDVDVEHTFSDKTDMDLPDYKVTAVKLLGVEPANFAKAVEQLNQQCGTIEVQVSPDGSISIK